MADKLSREFVRTKVNNLNLMLALNTGENGSYVLHTQGGLGHTLYRLTDGGRRNVTHGATSLREIERYVAGMMEGLRTERERIAIVEQRRRDAAIPDHGKSQAVANQRAAQRRLVAGARRPAFGG